MNKALDILLRNQIIFSELEDKRKHYNSFFEFSKSTGLGKDYKSASMKVRRAESLLYQQNNFNQ